MSMPHFVLPTSAPNDVDLQQLWWGKQLPDGVVSAILVPTSSEFLLRHLIQAAEKLGITYGVDRAKKENQLVIKQEIMDLTEEPELPDRPAEAAPQPPEEPSLPSQMNRNTGNFAWQPNQFRTLPCVLNKNFNYAGNVPCSLPMTGTGIPNMMPSFRAPPPVGIAPDLPFLTSNQNGEFRLNPDPGARLNVHFADERPLSGVVRRREEEEHGDDEQDGSRSRRSRMRIRRQHENEREQENEIFQEVRLDFRVEPGRVRHACQKAYAAPLPQETRGEMFSASGLGVAVVDGILRQNGLQFELRVNIAAKCALQSS